MTEVELSALLTLPTNSTYNEWSVIGSSCQHIHLPVFDESSYALVLHLISVLSSIFYFIATYCIIKKSTKSMGKFKWCLLNLQLWTMLTDCMCTILIVPRFYFPVIGGRAFGILFNLGMTVPQLIYVGFGCFGGMVASVAVLFVYRHQSVLPGYSRFKVPFRFLIVILGINYLIYVNMMIPAVWSSPIRQLDSKIEILKAEKCPPKDILNPDVFILQSSTVLLPYFCFLVVLVGAECGLLALHSAWCLCFSTFFQKLSSATRRMQLKFLLALLAQIAIPTAVCYAPIMYCAITTLKDHYNQFANDICVFVFVTHGLLSSICLLGFYESYRNHVYYLIFPRRERTFSSRSSINQVSIFVTTKL